jgi:hypothetical protein
MMIDRVERVPAPTRHEFEHRIVPAGVPVIITGGATSWRALAAWDPDYVKQQCGHRTVNVSLCPSGLYDRARHQPMRMGNFIDSLLGDDRGANPYYLAGCEVSRETLPEIADDFETPRFLTPSWGRKLSLFLGRDSVTGSHFHPWEQALFTQIQGRKRIVLCPPGHFSALYPKSALSAHFNWSRVDFRCPDIDRFPRFRQAPLVECTLEAGEMLFIPVHWWHAVFGPDWSVSGTFFWPAHRNTYTFPDPGVRCVFRSVLRRVPLSRKLIPRRIWES